MPQYVLEGDGEVQVGAGALTIRADVLKSTAQVDIDYLVDGAPSREARKPRSGLLIVPRVTGSGVIRVSPVGLETFPPRSLISLTIEVNEGVVDSEQILLSQLDLSGLPSRELVTLTADGSRISARASLTESDQELSEVAGLARVAAREVLGVDRVEPGLAKNVVIAVDGSASFEGRTTDGSVGLVLDVLLGISQVIAPAKRVDVALASDRLLWSMALTAAGHASALAELQAATDLSTGSALADDESLVREPGSAAGVFVVTDTVADSSTWQGAAGLPATTTHLVVLAPTSASALLPETRVPKTTVEPTNAGLDLQTRLRHDPLFLKSLVAALLVGFFPADSDLARKVSR